MRSFISSHVANGLAAEVIALLYGILEAHESTAADIWTVAIDQVCAVLLLGAKHVDFQSANLCYRSAILNLDK